VRTADGKDLPSDTEAGFSYGGKKPRLRRVGSEGVVRFPDAPVGPVRATAQASGYVEGSADVVVVAGTPAEVVVTLTPREK
jgi:hypothetical protein